MAILSRRRFLIGLGGGAVGFWLSPQSAETAGTSKFPEDDHHIYVGRTGTFAENVARVLEMAGGISTFIDADDIVLLKPNGQWRYQGYTHTGCLKALIDLILQRSGGFFGEIVIIENVQRNAVDTLSSNYCWNMSSANRLNNWPDMNYLELVQDYHNRGQLNVSAIPLLSAQVGDFVQANGDPASLPEGKHGWVATTCLIAANGRTAYLPYALLRSPYSGKIIDMKNGVWQDGGYTSQKVKLIFLPTLNNHGSYNSEDYAGPTSAVKCHLGVVAFNGPSGTFNLHNIGYNSTASQNRPDAVGEAIGHLITSVIRPAFYLTCAEYTGHRGRTTSQAAHTKTIGLCTDPVTLDYWMSKYVLLPVASEQTFMNPDLNNNLRKTLEGCRSKGVGTLDENRIVVHSDENVPILRLNRVQLDFGAQAAFHTRSQEIRIHNAGPGVLQWTAQSGQNWITVSPGTGNGDMTIVVGVETSGLNPGTYSGSVVVSAPGALQAPQTIAVNLTVFSAGHQDVPFGEFDIPLNNSVNISGAVPVSGWVLDGVEVESVKIYRENGGRNLVFVGDAVFVEGARPDVEILFPRHPLNYRSGWGYMLLTNMLPGGDGIHRLHAVARDIEGWTIDLGTKIISVNNAASVKPFGTIDTPGQGQIVSSEVYHNFGWVLTPQPKYIPYDGSTIGVFIDGAFVANVSYNLYRSDIADLFPGYANSNGSVGHLPINTRLYADGVHTIAWGVLDSAGAAEGIGSRYFTVLNNPVSSSLLSRKGRTGQTATVVSGLEVALPEDRRSLWYRLGFDPQKTFFESRRDEDGISVIRAGPCERIEMRLAWSLPFEGRPGMRVPFRPQDAGSPRFTAFLIVGQELRPPPVGFSFGVDGDERCFWQPGPGFFGRYEFLLIGETTRKRMAVELLP